jgi:hypothetical protein
VEIILNTYTSFFIDDADYELVKSRTWQINNAGYIQYSIKDQTIMLHRLLMNCPDKLVVDHIDHNKLNNCRGNLRICTRSQNRQNCKIPSNNKSGCKGVRWHQNGWEARIAVLGKSIHLGRFASFDEAVIAYCTAAKQHFGEFVCL